MSRVATYASKPMSANTTTERTNEWTAELPVDGRAASNLGTEYESIDDLIAAYRDAEKISDVDQVGSVTMNQIREFIHDRDPDAERARKENDEGVCTAFTTDHGLDDTEDDGFYFAFICPKCETRNPLTGSPDGFKNRPYACESCRWVSLLDADALDRFAEDTETDGEAN